jgi:hypothetical protein
VKLLVYTSVIGGYDRVFPPVVKDQTVDYVMLTDDTTLKVSGWRTHFVDSERFRSRRAANRYGKMLVHRLLPGYDASLYVDGNIRLLSASGELLRNFAESNQALRLFRHPLRDSVFEEIAACVSLGKVDDARPLEAELEAYRIDGFSDDQGLAEATIIMKNHKISGLDEAMALWWSLFVRFGNRDQLSLPYVLWKSGISHDWQDFNFREPNPWFGLYPHRGAIGVRPLYADLYARSYDSTLHRTLLASWHGIWALRRRLRMIRKPR